MLVRLRRDGLNVALPSIQFGLVAFILHVGPRSQASLFAIALLLACGLYGWLRTLQHARLILDTPTSRVGSAAQGYVELRGHGEPLAGTPVLSPLTGLPVIWYRLATYHRNNDRKWVHAHTDESDASFLLRDASGVCAVDPEGAEMLVRRQDTVERGDIRQVQWCLLRHDPIYVLGDFHTLGSITPELDTAAQVRDLLAEWKQDHQRLLARFDLDGDGQISLKEWELARAQAKREVAKQRQEVLAAPEAHVVRKPGDGRLYLISDLDPARIARRYRWWSALHLSIFLGSAAAVAWLSQA
ncbi:hypothetical protein GPA19_19945 [Azoarcus indigens]|uniref:EF-hand domain-containing protein n=1 Tax=Azoarcus indigens TaxID=29545 RepID=A0A4R6DJX3_9RHOO|nr:hypothetical protein [Azoarcus indigens]NMG67216.1 hypothetical protein [Azoarcus indigens]TDN44509.1 hypothetical protein C7389_13422 [Azoarcus indigens]